MRQWDRILEGNWLGETSQRARFGERVAARRAEFSQCASGMRVLLTEADPIDFAATLAVAVAGEKPVRLFLGSPQWGRAQQQAVALSVAPELVWGPFEACAEGAFAGGADACSGVELFPPTGGSTGLVRFARHNGLTLEAAAAGLIDWLGGGPLHSVCCLPLFHVSGLMQMVRAWVSEGTVVLAPWRELQDGTFPALTARGGTRVTSLVPTQLARLLGIPGGVEWLQRFDLVFLGGAAPWGDLLAAARAAHLPLAPCYGMTETGAQVAAMRPADFLAGGEVAAEVLPHASVEIVGEDGTAIAPGGGEGRIRVRSPSLFRGYWPDPDAPTGAWLTADRGRLDAAGRLHVLGRTDAVINSGGEKVDPALVEEAIRGTGRVQDVAVCGVAHAEWGEEVVAVVAGGAEADDSGIVAALRRQLAPYQVPGRIIRVREIPRTPAGKIDRESLTRLCRAGDLSP